MNEETSKQKILIEAIPEWEEIIYLVEQMEMGQLVIKVQDGVMTLSEYTIKLKPRTKNKFKAFPLT